MQHLEVVALDLAQQGAVDAGHHQAGFLCAPVGSRQQGQRFVVELVRAFGLKTHQRGEAIRVFALENFVRLDVELLQLIDGQVDAPAQCVFAHVAQDVGQLQRLAQAVGVLRGGRVGLAKNLRCHLAHHASDQVAVALQAGIVEVARLLQIHLAAFNDGLQVAWLYGVGAGVRHQRLHDRVCGRARKGLGHLALPPGQFAAGHAGVGDFIDHVVHLAAKRIKGRDGCAPGPGQEQKGVIEAAARGGGFLLDVLFRIHGARLSHGRCAASRNGPWQMCFSPFCVLM